MADALHWAAYVGVVLGILARTYVPYWIKRLKAIEAGAAAGFTFDVKYFASAIVALIGAVTTAQALLADFVLPATATNPLLAFWAGLVYAGIWNTVINALALDYKAPA